MTATPPVPPRPALADLTVGVEVLHETTSFERADLVRYAGASGDFNVIHWNERVATSVGLPNVIAHGMLTMARAIAPVVRWAGDPAAVVDYSVRFTKPVPVPDPGTTRVDIVGTVAVIDPQTQTVRIDLKVTLDGAGVLGRARATVRLPE